MLVSMLKYLLNTNDSLVVSNNVVRNYCFANVLSFSLLETKYSLQLKLYKEHIFISNIHVLLSHEAFMKFLVQKDSSLKKMTTSDKESLISKTHYHY